MVKLSTYVYSVLHKKTLNRIENFFVKCARITYKRTMFYYNSLVLFNIEIMWNLITNGIYYQQDLHSIIGARRTDDKTNETCNRYVDPNKPMCYSELLFFCILNLGQAINKRKNFYQLRAV